MEALGPYWDRWDKPKGFLKYRNPVQGEYGSIPSNSVVFPI